LKIFFRHNASDINDKAYGASQPRNILTVRPHAIEPSTLETLMNVAFKILIHIGSPIWKHRALAVRTVIEDSLARHGSRSRIHAAAPELPALSTED
jgi:hypothetical protein